MGLAWNLKAIVKLYKTSKGLLTCLLAGEFFCKDMTILLQPYVLFIIGVNIIGVCGTAVLVNFSCGISVILILICVIAVFSESAG